jgi:hypothetical protein
LGAFVLWRNFSAALLWQTKGMPNQQLTIVSCWFMNEGLTTEEKKDCSNSKMALWRHIGNGDVSK